MPLKHAKDVHLLTGDLRQRHRRCAALLCLSLGALSALPVSADDSLVAPPTATETPSYARYSDDPALAMTAASLPGQSSTVVAISPEPQRPAPAEIRAEARHAATSAQDSDDLIQRLRQGFAMPEGHHPRIEAHRVSLTGKQAYVDRVLGRASRFMYLAVTEAERRGLPTELALLPVIESAYDPMALSRSQAAGLWQFIPDTGRLFGLKQTWWYDGRRDPLESTRAAYDYLSQLYATFGDWELVLASYNAGPGTVSRAVKRNRAAGLPTDFWSLRLPAETMNYVPRFQAVVALFKDPQGFRVALPNLPNRPYFRTINTQGPLNLNDAAAVTGLDPELLRSLNPGLRRDGLDPQGPHHLHVPASLDVALENQVAGLASASPVRVVQLDAPLPAALAAAPMSPVFTRLPVAARQPLGDGRHRVQARETWSSIARAYHTTAARLSAANDSSTDTPLSIGRELTIPGIAASASGQVIQVASAGGERRVEIQRRVLPGETLESIRRQYKVTLAELRAWNGDLQTLRAGQQLILRILPEMLNSTAF